MSFSKKILCSNLRKARIINHLTQSQAAERLQMSALHYGRIERGTRIASLEQLDQIAAVYHTSVFDLLSGCFDTNCNSTIHTDRMNLSADSINELLLHCSEQEKQLCLDICHRIIAGA